MDGLVEKSSFPFYRSEYLSHESVNAAITHSFCRKYSIYALFCRKCRDYALFRVEFYAEFWQKFCGKNWRVEPLLHVDNNHHDVYDSDSDDDGADDADEDDDEDDDDDDDNSDDAAEDLFCYENPWP